MSEESTAVKESASLFWLLVIALVCYAFVLAAVLALALGTGWLLRKLVPGLETGTAAIVGMLATAVSLLAVFKLFGAVVREALLPSPVPEAYMDDEDEEPLVVYAPPFPARRRRQKRRAHR